MPIFSKKYVWLIVGLLLAVCIFASPKKAHALSNKFPDPNLSYHTAGGDVSDPPWPVSATVSKPGPDQQQPSFNQQLDAQVSVIKLYFTQPTNNSVVIEAMCKEIQDIVGVRADFKIARADGNENYDLGQLYFSDYSTNPETCADANNTDIPVGSIGTDATPLVQSTVNGHQGYYVAVLYVNIDESSSPGTQSFRVRTTTAGYPTFFEQTAAERHDANARSVNAFAMLDKYGAPGSKSQFGIDFAPSCEVGDAGDDVWMKWFDADYPGNGNANVDTAFTVVDLNTGETVLSRSGADLGGNDEFKSAKIHVNAGDHYRWVWSDVDRNNGIQLWMPFSEINTIVTCDRPPIGSIDSSDCNLIKGWAFDPDFPTAPIRVHVYVDGPAGVGTLIIGNPFIANQTRQDVDDAYKKQYPGIGNSPHGYSTDISAYKDAGTRTFYVYAIGTSNADGSQDPSKANWPLGSTTVGPCAIPTCNVVTSADPVQLNTQFSITLNYSYSGGPQGRNIEPQGRLNFDGGPTASYNYPASNGSGGSWLVGGNFVESSPGTYHAGARIVSSGAAGTVGDYNVPCPKDDIHVAQTPYVKFYGNDISAGGAFDTGHNNCSSGPTSVSPDPPPAIWTFKKPVSYNGVTYYGGGGSQFGARSLGENLSFASATDRNGLTTGPTTPTGLTFGNMLKDAAGVSKSISGSYGGRASLSHCIPDYWGASTNSLANVAPNQYVNGNWSETSPMNIPDSTQEVIFVNGDAYINHDLKFANSSWSNKDTSKIPSFYLIVHGNIYISNDVRNLDGVYVAQPNGNSGGNIYTCTKPLSGGLFAADQLYDQCARPLTVTGSFVAKQVHYQRVLGDVSKSISDAPAVPTTTTYAWTSNAAIPAGYDIANCTKVYEPGEPDGRNPGYLPDYTWHDDNYLCASQASGKPEWYYAPNVPAGRTCTLVNPPSEAKLKTVWNVPGKDKLWVDNQLCWPTGANLGLSFSSSGIDPKKDCTNMFEIADPFWDSNNSYICYPKPNLAGYSPENEEPNPNPSNGNIAEIFNFSQEMYLAKQPPVLGGVNGGGSGASKNYNAITSLPPIL
jgi:hypothetical protein